MKEKITKADLIVLLDKSQFTNLGNKYRAWSRLENIDYGNLTLVGTVSVGQEHNEEYQSEENYWSPEYPIALEYYPYYGCDIYSDGKGYFLVYQDFGGHAPEKRCRFVKKELLV